MILENLNLIACVSEDWCIGKDNDLIFKIKEDMQFFRIKTINKVVVYGRKTLESFPDGKPLPNRLNVVLTRNPETIKFDNVVTMRSEDELLKFLPTLKNEIFIIGGGEIYEQLYPYASTAYINKIKKRIDPFNEHNYTMFPDLSSNPYWKIVNSQSYNFKDQKSGNFYICNMLEYKNSSPVDSTHRIIRMDK